MFGHPICLNTPMCLDACSMFGCPPYVWMAHILRGCPYAPNTFVHPHMFGHPPYVWMHPVHTQHRESMVCQTKGVSIYLHTFGFPNMFGCPLYAWMPPMFGHHPVCLDAPTCIALLATLFILICLDGPCMFACPHPYVWMPHTFGHHPYIWMPPYVWMPCCMFG